MKLATLKNNTRDGQLVVVRADLSHYADASSIAPNLQAALDDWERAALRLQQLAAQLESGAVAGAAFDARHCVAPLPRAYEWLDGSAYLNHVELVRKARGAEMPPSFYTDPLMYQGGSGVLLGPTDDIKLGNVEWGCDFESEVCVILGDTPQGTTPENAQQYIRLIMLANDVSLRNLIPAELAKGFGFLQSKPATAFSPCAITPDELGDAWKDGRIHLPLCTTYNRKLFGDPNAGPEMQFSFYQLIAHITTTRALTAGTIIGSGTVSNKDRARGSSCLAEVRMLETIDSGKPTTPFMQPGDTVRIEMADVSGKNIFGTIDQKVVAL